MAYITVQNSFASNTPLSANPINVNFTNITAGLSDGSKDLNQKNVYCSAATVVSGIISNATPTTYTLNDAGRVRKELVNAEFMKYYSPKVKEYAYPETTTSLNTSVFSGGFQDGTHAYLVPYYSGTTVNANVVKFNMETLSYVSMCDLSSISGAFSFAGGFTDGAYGYCVPNKQYTATKTKLSNFAASGTSSVNLSSHAVSSLRGFWGGFTDGTYAYYVPHYYGVYRSNFTRIEINSFTVSGTSVLDLSAIDADLKGFKGGVIDRTYAYLCPTQNGKVPRIKLSDFSTVDVLDTSLVVPGFTTKYSAITTDGNFLYLFQADQYKYGVVIDLANFSLGGCTAFDMSTYNYRFGALPQRKAYDFAKALYDGRYIYVVGGVFDYTVKFIYRIDTLTEIINWNTNTMDIVVFWNNIDAFISDKYLFTIPKSAESDVHWLTRLDLFE